VPNIEISTNFTYSGQLTRMWALLTTLILKDEACNELAKA